MKLLLLFFMIFNLLQHVFATAADAVATWKLMHKICSFAMNYECKCKCKYWFKHLAFQLSFIAGFMKLFLILPRIYSDVCIHCYVKSHKYVKCTKNNCVPTESTTQIYQTVDKQFEMFYIVLQCFTQPKVSDKMFAFFSLLLSSFDPKISHNVMRWLH